MREVGPISALTPDFPLAANALAPLRRAAEPRGDSGFMPLWSGQNRSGCDSVPAAVIVERLAAGLTER
jgi:nitronate monooxygenase